VINETNILHFTELKVGLLMISVISDRILQSC